MQDHPSQDRAVGPSRSKAPWQSKPFILAVLVSIVGIAMWAYAATTRPQTAPSSGADARMVTGLSGGSSSAPSPSPSRLVDSAGPALSKFGGSFLGGFGLGYLSRKFLRWTMLLAAIVGAALYFAQRAGLIQLSTSDIERHVQDGLTMAKTEADQVKRFLTGYIPSATAAAIGGFMGFRRG